MAFVLVVDGVHARELILKILCSPAYPRSKRVAERPYACCAPVAPQMNALSVRRQRTPELRLQFGESVVDVVFQYGVRLGLSRFERAKQPTQPRPLPTTERPPLVRKPAKVHLEITARAGVTREIAKPPPKPLTDVGFQIRAERALPASESAERDSKIVQCLVIRRTRQSFLGCHGIRQVAEGHESDGSIGRFAEGVETGCHQSGIGNREKGIGASG
jgi:hypothetical protein